MANSPSSLALFIIRIIHTFFILLKGFTCKLCSVQLVNFPIFSLLMHMLLLCVSKKTQESRQTCFHFLMRRFALLAMWPSSWPNESNSSISGENFICLLQQTVVVCCFHVCLSLTAAWVISFLFASVLFLLHSTVLSSIFSHTFYNLVFLSPLFTCFLLLDFDMYGKCRQQKNTWHNKLYKRVHEDFNEMLQE